MWRYLGLSRDYGHSGPCLASTSVPLFLRSSLCAGPAVPHSLSQHRATQAGCQSSWQDGPTWLLGPFWLSLFECVWKGEGMSPKSIRASTVTSAAVPRACGAYVARRGSKTSKILQDPKIQNKGPSAVP